MKTRIAVWCGLCALSLLGFGCSGGAVGDGSLATISPADAEGLAEGCSAVLDSADDWDLDFARLAGNDTAIVVDGPDGSCIDGRDHVLEILHSEKRFDLAAHVVARFNAADPSPHPDLDGFSAADPSPHPDKPSGASSADPSPHPDTSAPNDDDHISVAIVIHIETGTSPGGTPAPPPPAPRAPGKDD